MEKAPIRQRVYLKPLTWLLSYPAVWGKRLRIHRTGMAGIKPPYLLLCNHNAFLDFKVTTAAIFPCGANYVVAIDGFIGREWLLRNVGGICKRKFTNDISLVRHIRTVLHTHGDILALYPEARYSMVGTNAELPESLGKIIRLLRVPVVILKMHGHHLSSPVWNLKPRRNRIEADLTCVFRPEELAGLSVTDINHRVAEAFRYDDYAWQKENGIRIALPTRAEGLHHVLYQCPARLRESRMGSEGTHLFCEACGKRWHMTEYGELEAVSGETEFSHIPDWFAFQREQVRGQLVAGTYAFSDEVVVEWLPNAKGYIRLGKARLTHDAAGFRLEGECNGAPFLLVKEPRSMYACHIEFQYQGKGDCIDLSTLEDTYYLYPQTAREVVTKVSLAVEELYRLAGNGKPSTGSVQAR
jgi:hypothetical protein